MASIGDQLGIGMKEQASVANRINFMLKVAKENSLKEEHVTKIYEEWAAVAQRIKKGGEMLQNVGNLAENRVAEATNLYAYLMKILGFYDLFFSRTLSRDHHKQLQSAILRIID